MLEVFELRKQASSLRQELSHALYKEDAAMRVLARIMRERDEARAALANMRASMGLSADGPSTSAAPGDVEMDNDAAAAEQSSFPAPLLEAVKSSETRLVLRRLAFSNLLTFAISVFRARERRMPRNQHLKVGQQQTTSKHSRKT